MIPILFDYYNTNLQSTGLGALADCTRCEVTEEINGIFECEFDYPENGPFYDQLINFGGVVGCVLRSAGLQLFDIYRYSATISGVVTFYASHVSYRLNNGIADGFITYGTPASVFSFLDSPVDPFDPYASTPGIRAKPEGPFTFTDYSGYTSVAGVIWQLQAAASFREILLSREEKTLRMEYGSVIQIWPGEYVFDNFDVKFYKNRGSNKGFQIRYGKNMNAVTRDRSTGDIVSCVWPIYVTEEYAVTGPPVYSPYMNTRTAIWEANGETMLSDSGEVFYFNAADLRAIAVNFADTIEWDDNQSFETLYAKLKTAAANYMSKNSTWRAVDNIEIDFIDLYGSPEYEDIKALEECDLGDFVAVYHPALGIVSENVEVMSTTYDVLSERYTKMELNTIRTTLAQTIIDYIGGSKK